MPAPVIYLNGFPGVGKLTLARALQPLIPNSRILHNHELIDPVELTYPRGSPNYFSQRARFRRKHLNRIKHDPDLWEITWIFTDSLTEGPGDYAELARGEHTRRFYSVVLCCGVEENERRLALPDRGRGVNGKLTDVDVLRMYRRESRIWRFGGEDEVEVDIEDLTVGEAAEVVRKFVERREMCGVDVSGVGH